MMNKTVDTCVMSFMITLVIFVLEIYQNYNVVFVDDELVIEDSNISFDYKECTLEEVTHGQWVAIESCKNCLIGNNAQFTKQFHATRRMIWKPHNCRMRVYSPAEMMDRLKGKHIYLIGDSVTEGIKKYFNDRLNVKTSMTYILSHYFDEMFNKLMEITRSKNLTQNDIIFVNTGAWLVIPQRYSCAHQNAFLKRVEHPLNRALRVNSKQSSSKGYQRFVHVLKVPHPSPMLGKCVNATSKDEYISYCGKNLTMDDTFDHNILQQAIKSAHNSQNKACFNRCVEFASTFKSDFEKLKQMNFGNAKVIWRTTQINLSSDKLGHQNCIKYILNQMAKRILSSKMHIFDIEEMTEARPESYINELSNHFFCPIAYHATGIGGGAGSPSTCNPLNFTIFDSNDVQETVCQITAAYF